MYTRAYGLDKPYPGINGTARNARLDLVDGYNSMVIDLEETTALVEVVQDYAGADKTKATAPTPDTRLEIPVFLSELLNTLYHKSVTCYPLRVMAK